MKTVRVGYGSAFWGDMIDPAVELVEKGNIDYIGFDHLADIPSAEDFRSDNFRHPAGNISRMPTNKYTINGN